MKKAGAIVRVDATVNIFADKSGTEASLPPVLFGSISTRFQAVAISTVTSVSLDAVNTLRVLHENRIQTRRPYSHPGM